LIMGSGKLRVLGWVLLVGGAILEGTPLWYLITFIGVTLICAAILSAYRKFKVKS